MNVTGSPLRFFTIRSGYLVSFLHVLQVHLLVATICWKLHACPNFAPCLHSGSRDTTGGIYRPKGELYETSPTILVRLPLFISTARQKVLVLMKIMMKIMMKGKQR